jgi:hypothetical protein
LLENTKFSGVFHQRPIDCAIPAVNSALLCFFALLTFENLWYCLVSVRLGAEQE